MGPIAPLGALHRWSCSCARTGRARRPGAAQAGHCVGGLGRQRRLRGGRRRLRKRVLDVARIEMRARRIERARLGCAGGRRGRRQRGVQQLGPSVCHRQRPGQRRAELWRERRIGRLRLLVVLARVLGIVGLCQRRPCGALCREPGRRCRRLEVPGRPTGQRQRPAPRGRPLLRADLQCVDRGAPGPNNVRRCGDDDDHHHHARASVRDADNGESRHGPRSGHDADHRGRHPVKVRCLDDIGRPGCACGCDHEHGTTTTTPGSGHTASGGGSAHGSSSTHRSIVASAASHRSGGGASSNVLPVILVAAVVAALGGLALFRWRRRPAEE